jgi:chromate transporter
LRQDAVRDRRVGCGELFAGFLNLGLLGFGGIAPWARYIIVDQRGWLTEQEYAEYVGFGQILPGSNTVNASVLIGMRFQGLWGAVTAVSALMTMPIVVLIALATLYANFGTLPIVRSALVGTAAAAAGMVAGTALKMAWRLRLTPTAIAMAGTACVTSGFLALPLLPTIAVLVPLSLGITMLGRRR